ncbi:hypothetical protein VTL71DRAFT_3857 [Oculimacula yallundae]|uniref:Uncharacterized protein n=1 Tax=Oculimacula yallundae TaxID=86028 RepID=A0ABR4C478_9HELO
MDTEKQAESLVDELEKLTHSERVARMVKIGTEFQTNPNAKTLLDHLASKSLYEQLLSLESCHGSRDLSFAKQIISSSSSKHLKKRAIDLIALFGSDEELIQALQAVPLYLQVATLHRLRHAHGRRKRLGVIEQYLKELENKEGKDKQFQRLFLLGSENLVEKHLPKFLDHFSTQQWLDLAKYHARLAQNVFDHWIERSDEDDRDLIGKINLILHQWLSHDYTVSSAVELFRTALKKVSISQLPITQLLEKSPERAVPIILSCEENLTKDKVEEFDRRALRKLPMTFFRPLFERYPGIVEEYEFTLFTPEQRLLVWQKYRLGWRNDDGTMDVDIIEALPTKERHAEARRVLRLKKFETNPSDRIPYIALLPWEEAMELQKPFIRSGDVEIRSTAIKTQVEAVKFDDAYIEDALKLVLSRKNEQDPVQIQMLDALFDIPSGRWKETHLLILDEIITSRLKSRDVSVITCHRILSLLGRILSVHCEWVAAQLGRVMRDHGCHYRFSAHLSGRVPVKECVATVEKEMSPFLDKLLRKKDAFNLIKLESIFEKQTKHWTEYLDTCEEMAQIRDIEKSSYSELLDIIRTFRPESLDWLVLKIYGNDDFACVPVIVSHVHNKRQNLLDGYLNYSLERHEDRKKAIKTMRGGFWRWTESQQEEFQKLLLKDIANQDTIVEDKIKCVQQLSLLTFVDQHPLFDLANNEESAVQEAALRALGDLDGQQGLSILIEALSDERARIAIYSLRKVLKTMPNHKTFELLSTIPHTKVTVAKETIRLIGELGTEECFQYLLGEEKVDLHVDVRVALHRALWTYLDREDTWKIFARAAENTDPKIAKAVCSIPEDGLNAQQEHQLLQVLLRVLSHDSPEVRIAALERCDTKPIQDPENILAPRLFDLIHSELDDEIKAAANAIFETYARNNTEKIGELYRRLLSDRKTLKLVHDTYMSIVSPYPGRKYLRPVTHLLLSIFKTDRLSTIRRVNLMFSGLPWAELRPYVFEIMPELHADALCAAERFIETNSTGWKEDRDDLLKVELGLKGSRDERARRLAFSFLRAGVDESVGWTDEERFRLDGYRNDESVLVAEAAWEFNVPEKGDDDSEDEDESLGDEMKEDQSGRDTVMEDDN